MASAKYLFLERLHLHLRPDTYLEIGVKKGRSLWLADNRCACVGIDPQPKISYPLSHRSRVLNMESDDFFANQPHLGVPDVYDLCFIDGLHLSDQALRDFIHIEERASHESTVVVIDDVLPGRPDIAKRDRPPSGPWAGDVWKVPYLLIRERSDLTVDVVDVPPAGLAIISGLSPGTSFWDTEDAIVSRMEAYPFAEALGFLESSAIQPDRAYFQRLGQGPTHSPSILLSRIRRHLRRVRPERLVRKLKS